jgi:hypothetical protein
MPDFGFGVELRPGDRRSRRAESPRAHDALCGRGLMRISK